LRLLFGSATLADVEQLQETFDLLQSKNADIAHSLSDQLTYVKKLDTMTRINTNTLTNLSSIVRDMIVQSHDRFQQLTRDIMWLNVTIYNWSEIYRVSQEERSIFWEVIVSVILSKKLYMNTCPIPNGFRDRAV
jgi:hypothetical protein